MVNRVGCYGYVGSKLKREDFLAGNCFFELLGFRWLNLLLKYKEGIAVAGN